MNELELINEARRRYNMDAQFHARVHVSADLLGSHYNLTVTERTLALMAAAMGCLMAELDPLTGTPTEA